MSANKLHDPVPEEAYGLENWLSIELVTKLFDDTMPDDEEWDVSKEQTVQVATSTSVSRSAVEVRTALYNPDFTLVTAVKDRSGSEGELELIKYKVIHELPNEEKVTQFRRQINLPWETPSETLRTMLGRQAAVIHEPSLESTESLPYRIEVGRFIGSVVTPEIFTYKDMQLEQNPAALRGLANLLFRIF